ncbi:MAG: chemotaxis protein CheX [Frankiales bacterium]|jgi:chemotaxis protein CheX|nr:chemotaxis protein CheX [Frankiales bacterium]MDX6209840.1 chemotaxis protein CheX [Frankiales bacterium]MDX6211185.1 chemotaxis protein CheX [Frankiales bacterium]MDX6222454.1 chemotaxis protein CheX [Frankiales bacterium]
MSVSMDSGMSQEIEVVSPDDVCIITQDVWASFLDVHIERIALDESLSGRPSIVGAVRVTDAWFGAVVLEVTPGLARTVAATMFSSTPDVVTDAEVVDALGELTNMIGGNIKSLLPAPSQLSLPMVADSVWPTSVPGSVDVCRIAFSVGPETAHVSVWQS